MPLFEFVEFDHIQITGIAGSENLVLHNVFVWYDQFVAMPTISFSLMFQGHNKDNTLGHLKPQQ